MALRTGSLLSPSWAPGPGDEFGQDLTNGIHHASIKRELMALEAIVTTCGRAITLALHKHPSRPIRQG